ncbi:MAG: hypothetical protein ACTSQY_01960, partial [Candidatus Odinarchaeia archaeon]
MDIIWAGDLFIKLKNTVIALDPHTKTPFADLTLISHAHSDHTAGFRNEGKIISSKQTLQIFKKRTGTPVNNWVELNYHEVYAEKNFSIENYNSGHILGSSQFRILNNNQSILYTSDINCVDSMTQQAAEPINTDILIIESTYGKPQYAFPIREEIYFEMVEWAVSQLNQGKIPVFRAYTVGKSQEIIRIMNKYLNVPIIVDDKIAKISEVYSRNNIPLNYYSLNSEKGRILLKDKKGIVVISSLSHLSELIDPSEVEAAFASGWALKFKPR